MQNYYVNKSAQANGDHEVHTESCLWLPRPENREFLGFFTSCSEAVRKAREYYSQVDGCKYCCEACHKH